MPFSFLAADSDMLPMNLLTNNINNNCECTDFFLKNFFVKLSYVFHIFVLILIFSFVFLKFVQAEVHQLLLVQLQVSVLHLCNVYNQEYAV